MNLPWWLANLAFWAAQVALLVVVAALLVRFLDIRLPRVLLIQWRLLLAVSLLLPFIEPWHRPEPGAAVSIESGAVFVNGTSSSNPASQHGHFPLLPFLAEILCAVILVGILLRLAIFGLGLLKLRRLRHSSSPIPAGAESFAVLEEISALVGIRAEFRLCEHVDSPVTFGFTGPVVLLPERFSSLNVRFQYAIACHELLHVRRHDWAYHLGEEILRVVFWFHPAILWVIGRIRLAREQVVDSEVVKLTQARKSYLEALLEFTAGRGGVATVPAPPFLAERQLAERVTLMLKEVRMSRAKLVIALMVVACSLSLAAVLGARAFPLRATSGLSPSHAAQAKSQSRPPLELISSSSESGKPGSSRVQILLRNTSDKCIQGFVLNFLPAGPDGKSVGITVKAKPNGQLSCYKPGSVIRSSPSPLGTHTASGEPIQSGQKVIVDFVVFSDGSFWGPGKLVAQDSQLLGMIQGMSIANGDRKHAALMGATAEMWAEAVRTAERAKQRTATAMPQRPVTTKQGPAPKVIRVGWHAQAAKLVHSAFPVYPAVAKKAGIQGTVVFLAIIGKDGSMEQLNYVSGPPLLVQAAKEAIIQWKFKPTLLNGEPVEVETTIATVFQLGHD